MTDCDLPRNPVRPLLHLKRSWLKRRASNTLHLSCPTLPCLRLCLLHDSQWEVAQWPFVVLSALLYTCDGQDDFQTKWISRWRFSRFMNIHGSWRIYNSLLDHTAPYLFNLKSFKKPTHHLKNQSWRANPQGLQDLAGVEVGYHQCLESRIQML